jgi:hypothetical protein
VPAGRATRIDPIESLRLEKLHSGLSLGRVLGHWQYRPSPIYRQGIPLRTLLAKKRRKRTVTEDLGYGRSEVLLRQVEEVSRLLNSYERTILAPGSWLLTSGFHVLRSVNERDIKGEALPS